MNYLSLFQYTVPSAGIVSELGTDHKFNLSIANNAIGTATTGTAVTVLIESLDYGTATYSVPYATKIEGLCFFGKTITYTGTGAVVTIYETWPEEFKVDVVTPTGSGGTTVTGTVSVSNTVNTDIGQAGTYQRQSLTWNGGTPSTAPKTGVWTVAITPSSNGSYPKINSNKVAPVGDILEANIDSTVTYTFIYPVTSGSTYAVSVGAVVDGTIQ
jgi:hypothetical protein